MDIAGTAAYALLPYGAGDVPRMFRDLFPDQQEVFPLDHARQLVVEEEVLLGEVSPGHSQVEVVLGFEFVARRQFQTTDGLYALMGRGATVMIRSLHTLVPAVRDVCQVIANITGRPSHSNAFWKPAGGQAFPVHSDAETVIMLEVAGSNMLAVYPRVAQSADDPAVGWMYEGKDAGASPPFADALEVHDLKPGYAALIPPGYRHYGVAGDEGSLHVSFSVLHPWIKEVSLSKIRPVRPATT